MSAVGDEPSPRAAERWASVRQLLLRGAGPGKLPALHVAAAGSQVSGDSPEAPRSPQSPLQSAAATAAAAAATAAATAALTAATAHADGLAVQLASLQALPAVLSRLEARERAAARRYEAAVAMARSAVIRGDGVAAAALARAAAALEPILVNEAAAAVSVALAGDEARARRPLPALAAASEALRAAERHTWLRVWPDAVYEAWGRLCLRAVLLSLLLCPCLLRYVSNLPHAIARAAVELVEGAEAAAAVEAAAAASTAAAAALAAATPPDSAAAVSALPPATQPPKPPPPPRAPAPRDDDAPQAIAREVLLARPGTKGAGAGLGGAPPPSARAAAAAALLPQSQSAALRRRAHLERAERKTRLL